MIRILNRLFLLSLCFTATIAYSQDLRTIVGSAERKGDKHFFNFAYTTAINYYQDALEDDSTNYNIKLKIGESYRKLNDPVNAELWLGQGLAEATSEVEPKYKLHYAQALSSNKKYDEAKEWFGNYKMVAKDELRATKRLEGLNNIDKFFKDSIFYEIKPVSINYEGLDFSPMWYNEGIVFVSSRSKSIFKKNVFNWDKSSYLDLYYSKGDAFGNLAKPEVFNKKVNTKYHEGPLSFYDNEQKVVFTRNNYYKGRAKKSKDGITKLKLYFAEKQGDDWGKIRQFPYNNDEYSVGHPSITEDGKKMFFASDMPGGYGETDIYVTYYRKGEWTKPKNLGNIINTEGKEMFPYFNHGDLYFSSDGHEGLGGLDCYVAPLVNDEPVSVRNLGHPVSSSYDDFSLIITKDDRYGYFSTNRDNTVYDNIYYFLYNKNAGVYVRGTVIDNHYNVILPESTVSLLDEQGNVVQDTLSDDQGNFEFKIQHKKQYTLTADKLGYHRINIEEVMANDPNEVIEGVELRLEPPHHVVSVKAIDDSTKAVIADAEVHVLDLGENELVEISKRGSYHHEFETKGGKEYRSVAVRVGYFSNTLGISIGYDHVYDTLFFEVPLKKIEIGKAIKLENIYYDLDKSFIRPDAAVELDKLVRILRDNPTIEIELGSHTDSRGSDSYNKSLSQRRADSAVEYIISKGISANRITAQGYGETALTNQCSNGVRCTKEEHQANRRTEFKVTKF